MEFPNKELVARTVDLWQSQFNRTLTEAEVCQVLEGLAEFVSVLEIWNLPTDSGRNEEK